MCAVTLIQRRRVAGNDLGDSRLRGLDVVVALNRYLAADGAEIVGYVVTAFPVLLDLVDGAGELGAGEAGVLNF